MSFLLDDEDASIAAARFAWQRARSSASDREQQRLTDFPTFLVEHRNEAVSLMAASRRIGLTDAARYAALETYFLALSRVPHCFAGPRSRHLAVATCISLAVKLVERLAIGRQIVADPVLKRHNVRVEDIMELEGRFFVALDGLFTVPPWWLAIEATLDTRLASFLFAGGISLRPSTTAVKQPAPSSKQPLAAVSINAQPNHELKPNPSDAATPDSTSASRRRCEVAARVAGLIMDRLLLASPKGSSQADGETQRLMPCSWPPNHAQAVPLLSGAVASAESLRAAASFISEPETCFAALLHARLGFSALDAELFGLDPHTVESRFVQLAPIFHT